MFSEIVSRSAREYAPHHIVVYLNDLASCFNAFYANNQILDENDIEVSKYRLALTKAFTITMRNGLALLGIRVPERM
jgi:arginyl-tRNA synthetase